jgi:predicted phosphodiesterase
MRIHLLSDLHLEFEDFIPDPVDVDVVILAGDIGQGDRGIRWARRVFAPTPVLYVMGNHEYYGEAYPKLLVDSQQLSADGPVALLENRTLRLGDVTFLGATLWTDFRLDGERAWSMDAARASMSDYRHIRVDPAWRLLRPEDTVKLHERSVRWLAAELDRLRGERVVVVTHHAPTRRSIDPRFLGDSLTPAFVSDLEPLVESSGALLWAHGHVHRAFDYRCGATRVVSNPRGYPSERDHGFDPGLVIDL